MSDPDDKLMKFAQKDTVRHEILRDLEEDGLFTDVCFVSESNTKILMHKTLIMNSSKFLKNIFATLDQEHNVLIFDDVNTNILTQIKDFLYTGRCIVQSMDLREFTRVGELLEIEEITNASKNLSLVLQQTLNK